MKERQAGEEPVNVVIRSSDGVINLLVDEIGDVVEVSEDTFEPPPETLGAKAREMAPPLQMMIPATSDTLSINTTSEMSMTFHAACKT
ncbi:MAG: hypothetical protein ACRD2P_06145 [Terriglobia bacterium]